MDQSGGFRDRDLYVALYDRTGKCLAHGATPGLVGKNLMDLKDVDGKPFARIAFTSNEPTWVDYKWPNPTTKQVEQKSTYVVPVDDFVVTVGAYKQ
jgi:signal transduction histidine kinase